MSAEAAPEAAVLEFRDVRKAFGGNPVLRGLDLCVRRGETFTLLGGSGSGKSVTLKLAIGLLHADAGRVWVEGREIGGLAESGLVEVRRGIGMVFQGAALFDSVSVYENVAYPLREHLALPEAELGVRVRRCLEAVGLPGAEALDPAELSGGMRKRVGVARAIALEPRTVLYDEPTTGLDPGNARRIALLIRELQSRLGVTSVVVTHDLELCFAVSDRAALLADGRIALLGRPDELRASTHPAWRDFLEGKNGRPEEEMAHGV